MPVGASRLVSYAFKFLSQSNQKCEHPKNLIAIVSVFIEVMKYPSSTVDCIESQF